MTSLKTSIKTITYLSDIGCLEIQGASLISKTAYVCNGNKTMEVVYINTTAGNSYAVINQMDEMIPMQLMKMASGANYEAINKRYSYKLYTKGKKANLVEGNDNPVLSNCSSAE
ncbi:c-type lysozyme inhibitor [Escherichia coli]|uniref:c-type lysozyme inhibitor n=1 Tax=Escherichia coli TaxID=562 RepID=UPI000FFC5368|nr:c-type lysozyme inhibitor [Escherichia coli]NOH09945.1 c-type lysozyme inhibitor [Escherichia coli]QLK71379.1 c-type lysozyme inhibitor [Escherichia coli]RXA95196.1 c-type lysozyme inhibitor [Escherichia coli]TEV13201.1 c-type lysozyme inhibitor [Escherichia coli]TEV41917.1 c-type lysozyme inhibitor [Escherichia coli]